MGSRELKITMNRLGGLILLFTFIIYTKCATFTEGDCFYRCDADGSCKVNWNGSFRPGGTEASCFSPQFGGSCFGKVDGCKDCNQVCVGGSSGGLRDCEIKGLCTCQITSRGKECVGIPQENFPSGGRPSGGSSSSGGNCRYQCQGNGGCQVFSSSGSGSCFPRSFGGSCSGTPR